VNRIERAGKCRSITIVTNDRFFADFRLWAEERKTRRATLPLYVLNDGADSNENRLGAVRDLCFALSHHELKHLAETDLLVCACDNLVGLDFGRMLDFYAETGDPVVAVHPEANRERLHLVGVVELKENQYVKAMEEKPRNPRTNLACCPFYVFPPSVLKLLHVYFDQGGNPDAPGHFVSWIVGRMPLRAYLFDEPVYALDSVETYHWLNANVQQVEDDLG